MILGIGSDLVQISRLERALQRAPRLLNRLFHITEQSMPIASLAARFAAKEALAKAVGQPSRLTWSEIAIEKDDYGKPILATHGETKKALSQMGVTRSHVSLSHDGGFASAMVLLEGRDAS